MLSIRRRQRRLDDFPVALTAAGMGQAAETDHFRDTEGKAKAGRLRQYRQAPGTLLARPIVQPEALEVHAPGSGRQFATQHAEQAALAGAIGPEHT